MKSNRNTEQLGIFRPEIKPQPQEVKIVLKSKDGNSNWTTTLDLETGPNTPPKMLILELPSRANQPTGEMRQISNAQSEFTVDLVGAASPATLTDLSATPRQNWMATMFTKFASCPAAIAVLVTRGTISVTLHSEE